MPATEAADEPWSLSAIHNQRVEDPGQKLALGKWAKAKSRPATS